MVTPTIRRRLSVITAAVATGVLAASLAACSNPEAPAAEAPSERDQYVLTPDDIPADSDAIITIWTDDARKPGFEAYQAANPDVKLDILTVDGNQYATKIQLANKAGSGWPDIIYPLSTSLHAQLASAQYEYFSQPLDGIVDQSVLDGFGDGLGVCTYGGYIYCLRNDLAPSVLYYNTEKVEEFGYAVPETMDEFVELAQTVAEEHPGYVLQVNGDVGQTYLQYYQSSGCPYAEQVDDATIRIDMSDERCVRASEVLDALLAAGVMKTDTLSDAQHKEMGEQGQVLMSVNANWRADYTWKGWNWPAGTLGVAPMPSWGDGDENDRVGNEGGGGYILSRHAENMATALDIIEFMSTGEEFQLTAGTMPAYEPLRDQWLEGRLAENPLLADPAESATVFAESAERLDAVNTWVGYEAQAEFPIDELRAGKTLVDSVAATFQQKATNAARSAGYTVVNE